MSVTALPRSYDSKGLRRWGGIPYARASRFASPTLVDDLPDDATGVGPAPAQRLPYYEDPGAPVSEDCLNLTIWAPSESSGHPLPVVVWFYGGGFEHGACTSQFSDASILAEQGPCISVSVNYRLGALGFISLNRLEGFSQATNLGLQDAIAALAWIHRHIADFGGDPGRVTVVGESAGAFLACALLAARDADGLFHQLVLFSGGASRIVPQEIAQQMSQAFVHHLSVAGNPEALRTMSVEQLWEAQEAIVATDIGVRNGIAPQALGIVDDSSEPSGVLSDHPMRVLESGGRSSVALLICTTSDEIALFRQPSVFDPPSLEAVAAEISAQAVDKERARRICQSYAEGDRGPDGEAPQSPGLVRSRMLTDWIYRLPAARAACAHARAGGRSYLAVTHRVDGANAGHACDAPALLGQRMPGGSEAAHARDAQVSAAVLSFVRDGSPGWPALPHSGEIASVGVFGQPYDAAADYCHILSLWKGIDRP